MNGSNDQDDEDTRFSDLKKNFTVSAGFRRENEEMEGDPDVVGLKRSSDNETGEHHPLDRTS